MWAGGATHRTKGSKADQVRETSAEFQRLAEVADDEEWDEERQEAEAYIDDLCQMLVDQYKGGSSKAEWHEELQAIADTGGVIGILSSTHLPDLETYMEHFEYLVDLVGIDHVAFGPDVLYGDHTSLLEVLSEFHGVELPDSTMENPYVKGLENPTEAWNNIPRWLVKNDYSDEEIEKVLGGNIIRVLKEVW